jgi:salicylate hydroxylase
MKKTVEEGKKANPDQSFENSLRARIAAFGGEEKLNWIYGNDIEEVWKQYLVDETKSLK